MADAVVTFAVERLGDLLIQEARFLSGVKGEVEDIQAELRQIKSFLKDAAARQSRDETVRNWIRDAKSLAGKMEDLLEVYAIKVASKGKGGVKNVLRRLVCLVNEGIALHVIGSEIAGVKSKLSNLNASFQSYGIRSILEGESSRANDNIDGERERWRRMSYLHLVEDNFVGMDDNVEQLVSLLINERSGQNHRLVAIWGMGGLGKTTLAKKVCNHLHVRQKFECFAWVCITQKCLSIRNVLQDIFEALVPGERKEEIVKMRDQELVLQLYNFQQEKRCLIVIDDIWEIDDWECLRPAFPIDQKKVGSKLLLTTRKKEVAKLGHVHELQCLSEDDGWLLLRQKAFPDEFPDNDIDDEMKRLGREMVRKCGGLPLAIVVLGGVLKTKCTVKDWMTVNRAIGSHLHKGNSTEERYVAVKQVLALSFNDLPPHLKKCFLYFGEYLEDEVIWVNKLYLMWIVGGVISAKDLEEGETMIDVAERYLGDFAQRSMVQVEMLDGTRRTITTKFESCTLHDLMHDLCLSIMKEEEFSNVTVIKSCENELVASSTSALDDFIPSRLAIYIVHEGDASNVDLEPILGSCDCQVRGLLVRYNTHEEKHGPTVELFASRCMEYPSSLEMFTRLRVLELQRINFPEGILPRGMKRLVHLRFLKLKYCLLKELPSFIGDFRYLQVLDIEWTGWVVILPNVFWKMRQLSHLLLPFRNCVKGDTRLKLDGSNKLDTVTNMITSVFNVKDIAKLANLRYVDLQMIGMSDYKDVVWFFNYLHNTSHNIQSVRLTFEGCDFCSSEGLNLLAELFRSPIPITLCSVHNEFPAKLKFDSLHNSYLVNLTYIIISGSEFEDDSIQILEKLPNLQILLLFSPPKQMVCSSTGFPQLKALHLMFSSDLEEWTMEEGAMPNLFFLRIKQCYNLKMLPDQLRSLAALKTVKILGMPEEFVARVRAVNGVQGPDFDKISHVPTVVIG